MKQRSTHLMLDSFAIGVAAATFMLCAVVLLDPTGTGGSLVALGRLALAAIWLHLSILIAPFGTLVLLARMAE